jgi:hypothetical protein
LGDPRAYRGQTKPRSPATGPRERRGPRSPTGPRGLTRTTSPRATRYRTGVHGPTACRPSTRISPRWSEGWPPQVRQRIHAWRPPSNMPSDGQRAPRDRATTSHPRPSGRGRRCRSRSACAEQVGLRTSRCTTGT